jgi:hypothetical protein
LEQKSVSRTVLQLVALADAGRELVPDGRQEFVLMVTVAVTLDQLHELLLQRAELPLVFSVQRRDVLVHLLPLLIILLLLVAITLLCARKRDGGQVALANDIAR